jgi:serine/threonine protein kinase
MSDDTLREADTWEGPRSEGPGSRIGPFTLLRQIGEGGFGVVFEAEQEHPVKRRVALKVIKLGMDTREVIARFDAERQALAMMEHPHIARVLDAGATDSGRPYFVMELVDGEPIAGYCDQNKLSIDDRLRLFQQVCEAVQHAHTKGVIHRDLKPNNVLVSTHDGKPFAKVIDFGIAKATSGHLTEKTLATELNQVMGTPLYMSPEQASGSADIDTRTDIYSLGVILYELLTGTTPVDALSLRSAVFAEIQRIICEVEPPRPSVRLVQAATTLGGIATQRGSEPRKLTRTVRGELDWIVMKAIEKERGRRYETANGLAMDLRRYLAAEPVLAAPPSASYRLQKFVRRHKGAVAAGSLIAASLLIGIVGFAWQARIAQARANELEQVSKFQAEMLGQVDPTQAGVLLSDDVRSKYAAALAKANVPEAERSARIASFAAQWQQVNATDTATDLIDRTILKPAVAAIDKQFKNQPLVDAALKQVLADRYVGLGLYDAAMPLQQSALAIRKRELGMTNRDTLKSMGALGEILQVQGKLDEAEPVLRMALANSRRALGEDDRDTLEAVGNMGGVAYEKGRLSEAENLWLDALRRSRRTVGEADPFTVEFMNNLGSVLSDEGKFGEAESYYREALKVRRRILGPENPSTVNSINNLGVLLQSEGKLAEAEPFLREALQIYRRISGEEHPDTLNSINNLAVLLRLQGKLGESEVYSREVVDKRRRILGDDHPSTVASINNLAVVLQDEGKLEGAEANLSEAVGTSQRVLGKEHPTTLIFLGNLGSVIEMQGHHDQVAKLLAPAEAATRKAFSGDQTYRISKLLMSLGKARTGLAQFAAAEANLLEAHDKLVHFPSPRAKDLRDSTQAIVDLYVAWHAAEPGKGYDAKAAEWKQKLDALDATAPASAEPKPSPATP